MGKTTILQFLRNWTLPVAMGTGAVLFALFTFVPGLEDAGVELERVTKALMPWFVFSTLLVTFCKVEYTRLRPAKWHVPIVLAQVVMVALVAVATARCADAGLRLVLEGMLICIICPTASAAPVVTSKLGGDLDEITAYTILSSVVASLSIPFVFPLVDNATHIDLLPAFLMILRRISVVILLPLVLGFVVRHWLHGVHAWIVARPNLGFYLWCCLLVVVTYVTLRNISHSTVGALMLLALAASSLVACLLQFGIGKWLGHFSNSTIEGGQALGQKNTALAIWIATAYLNPVSAVAPGCYLLWHNIVNGYQLWRYRTKQ